MRTVMVFNFHVACVRPRNDITDEAFNLTDTLCATYSIKHLKNTFCETKLTN